MGMILDAQPRPQHAEEPAGDKRQPKYTPEELAENERLWDLVAQIQLADSAHLRAGLLGEFYRSTVSAVQRFVYARVYRRAAAEDIVSEVYERALVRIDRITRASGSPAAWLITVARNLVADHYKRSWTKTTILVPEVMARTPEGRPEHIDAPDLTADEVLEVDRESRTMAALHGALDRLVSHEQQEVMRMRYLEGVSVEGTATAMGKSAGAIKAITYRASRKLARDPYLAEFGPRWDDAG